MSETIEDKLVEVRPVAAQNIARAAKVTDQGPAVPWGVVGDAFGWLTSFYENPDYEGAVCLTLKRGDIELTFDPEGVTLTRDDYTTETVHGDEAVLAIIRFAR